MVCVLYGVVGALTSTPCCSNVPAPRGCALPVGAVAKIGNLSMTANTVRRVADA